MTHFLARPEAGFPSIHPASAMQEAMLRRSLLAPQAGDYLQQFRWTWTGPLDSDAFTRAWAILAERHEALRCSFKLEADGQISMIVDPHAVTPVASNRVRQRKPDSVAAFLQSARILDRERGFSLEEPPLMRFAIHHLGRDRAEILWTSHHALFDGRGRLILLREFRTIYQALIRGDIAELDPAPRYSEYLSWYRQHHFCESDAFWQRLGKGTEPMPPLAEEQSPSTATPAARARHSIRLTTRVTKNLKTWSETHRISLNTLTQGAWALVLARMSNRKAVSFGAPRAGRHPPVSDAPSMVGVFVNTVPIRITVDDHPSKLQWLREIRSTWKEMRPHEQTPVGRIAKAWNWPDGKPLFDTLVGFEKYQLTELVGSGIDGVDWGFELEATTEIPLTVQVYDGRRIRIEMTSSVEAIDQTVLKRMASRMEQALIALVQNEDAPLASIECIPEVEARTLAKWSRCRAPYPSGQTLHGLFSRQARARPDATALKMGTSRRTYGEVEAEANRLAHRLVAAGVVPGDRIGLLIDRSIDQVMAMLGILKAGAAYLPLDPEYPDARLQVLLKSSRTRVILVDRNHGDRLGSSRLKRLPLEVEKDSADTRISTRRPLRVTVGADNPAYVMFTSGSTGQPKGVEVPHRAVVRLLFGIDYVDLGPRNRILYLAPAAFDASTFEIWGALLHGGCCVVFPDRVPTLGALADCLRTERIDTLWLTSSLFNFVIDEAPETLRPVKQLLTGGEALSPSHIARAQQALPDTRLINGYGPTETTTFACCHPIPDGIRADQKSIPIGRPIGNTNCHIVDAELRPVPIGTTGELLIGGAGVALGYLNQPAMTAERFLPSPFHAGDRLYRTGDLARWREDGLIEYIGRMDHQVKIRGHRIEPGEIEAALCRHPEVRQAAVLVLTDPVHGKSLSAWVAAPGGDRPGSQALTRFLEKSLPAYLIPSRIQVIAELPRNVNGKIDRRALEETSTEEPAVAVDPVTVASQPPVTEGAISITRLFAEILNRPATRPDESFFCIGGDSLHASRLIYRLSRQTGIEFSLTDLHAAPTPRELARLARDRTADMGKAISSRMVRLSNRSRARPSGNLVWYFKTFRPNSRRKGGNISRAFRIRGPLNQPALREAIDLFIARHEAMRSRVWMDAEGEVRVTVEPLARVVIQKQDLSDLPAHQRLARAKENFRVDAQKRINLAQASTPRVKLTRLRPDDHFITFFFPHGHFDAVSLALFYEEVSAFYETLLKGEKPDWPKPKYHPIDYVAWERRQLTPELKRSMEPFWKETISGPPPGTWFPSDGPVGGTKRGSDRTLHFLLPPDLASGLRTLSQRSGTTVFMAMLASNAVLVNRYTGQTDFLICSVIDGRAHPVAARMVGHLGRSLYFRAQPDPSQSFSDFLGSSSREWMEAVQHRAYPVGEIVTEVLKEQGREGEKITPFFIVHGADDPGGLRLAGTRTSPVHRHFGGGPNLPKIEIRDTAEGISVLISYQTYTFKKASILRYMRRYEEIIRQVVEAPGRRIAKLPDYRDPSTRPG